MLFRSGPTFATKFQAKMTVFHKNWVNLDQTVDGHIKLAKMPLTFENVFGPQVDRASLDYVASRVKNSVDSDKDMLAQMTLGVESASGRIIDLLGVQKGNEVLDGLRREIELQREDRLIKFAWDTEMYRNPPINWNPAIPFASTSAADLRGVRAVAEELVNMEDEGGVINSDMALANIGDYVIVKIGRAHV